MKSKSSIGTWLLCSAGIAVLLFWVAAAVLGPLAIIKFCWHKGENTMSQRKEKRIRRMESQIKALENSVRAIHIYMNIPTVAKAPVRKKVLERFIEALKRK